MRCTLILGLASRFMYWRVETSTFLIVALAVLAIIGVLVAKDETTKKKHRALERNLLKCGFGEGWLDKPISRMLDSLGHVAYLVWLLHHERRYRDFQGSGENQYPPDWEWRRRFVYLRDCNTCQGEGCGVSSGKWMPLDCHHLKPISEFAPGEPGIHALTNLVTLCPICHASQHPENARLEQRARLIWSQQLSYLPWDKRPMKARPFPDLSYARPICPTQAIGGLASPQSRTEEGERSPQLSAEAKEKVLLGVKLAQDYRFSSSTKRPAPVSEGGSAASFEELLELAPREVQSIEVLPVCQKPATAQLAENGRRRLEFDADPNEIATYKIQEEQGRKSEKWLEQTGRQFVKQSLSKGSHMVREGENPVVKAFNEALRKERRRKVN